MCNTTYGHVISNPVWTPLTTSKKKISVDLYKKDIIVRSNNSDYIVEYSHDNGVLRFRDVYENKVDYIIAVEILRHDPYQANDAITNSFSNIEITVTRKY